MRPRVVLVLAFYALMFTYAGVNAYQTISLLRSDPGWDARWQGDRLLVRRVTPGGPATGLRAGDEIVSFNGQPTRRMSRTAISGLNPGVAYSMVVERDGQRHEFNSRTVPVPLSHWLMFFALAVLLPAIVLSTGLTVFLLKPDDKQALLLALLFAVFIPPTAFHLFEGLPAPLVAVMYVGPLITPLAFYFLLHFFLVFPEPSPVLRRFPRLEWLLYVPYPLVTLPANVTVTASGESSSEVSAKLAALDILSLAAVNLYVALAIASLLANYRRAGPTGRRKLRVVVAGTVVGLLPGVIVFFALPWFDFAAINPTFGEWLPAAAALAFPVLPLSFAYAIARHRVIPVSLMIRRSVQYLLAKNALRALLALPLVALAVSVAARPERTLGEILFRNTVYFYLLAFAALAVTLVYRRRVGEWVDRKFFREQYDQEKILRALVEDIKRLDSMGEMSRRITEEVERALHPESVYLFYRESGRGELSLSHSSGGAAGELRVPEDFRLLRLMELQGGAHDLPFPPKVNLPPSEKEWLAGLGARLIVPLVGTDSRLAGLFLLGEKKSEVPYTARDRELLEAVAAQVALVYENVRLKERTRQDRRVRQEVLSRLEGRDINLLKECPACGACFDGAAERCERDGSELQLSLPVERTVEGRYRLERLLGKGGMGAVYEATDLRLSRRVALKILGGQMFGDRKALRRFEREAQAAARLAHPNIVAVHDYGELQTEGAFLVMELVEGESLGALLRRERRLAPERAAELFDQALEGLKAAHAAGVVHRDLKPDNLFISPGAAGRPAVVRLLDFGLAKLTRLDADATQGMTTPGVVLGTFGYMSPEQLAGEEVDERTDIFSIGVMLVEALTGRRPFQGRTLAELIHSVRYYTFQLPGESPEARRLDDVLRKCLARERSHRHPSAEALQAELIPAIRGYTPPAETPPESSTADTVLLPREIA